MVNNGNYTYPDNPAIFMAVTRVVRNTWGRFMILKWYTCGQYATLYGALLTSAIWLQLTRSCGNGVHLDDADELPACPNSWDPESSDSANCVVLAYNTEDNAFCQPCMPYQRPNRGVFYLRSLVVAAYHSYQHNALNAHGNQLRRIVWFTNHQDALALITSVWYESPPGKNLTTPNHAGPGRRTTLGDET